MIIKTCLINSETLYILPHHILNKFNLSFSYSYLTQNIVKHIVKNILTKEMLIILWICMLTVYIFQLITLEIISLTNGVCNLVLGTMKSCLGYKLESKPLMTDSKSV